MQESANSIQWEILQEAGMNRMGRTASFCTENLYASTSIQCLGVANGKKKKKKEKMGHLILKEVHQRVEVALDVQFVQS